MWTDDTRSSHGMKNDVRRKDNNANNTIETMSNEITYTSTSSNSLFITACIR